VNYIESFLQDVRYGLRMLAKNPGSTAMAIIALALGIGANTGIFSVVDNLLLRPASAERPEELVAVYIASEDEDYGGVGYPEYAHFRDHNQAFADVFGYALASVRVSCGSDERRVVALLVSGNYFSALGGKAEQGRTFLPEEDQVPQAHPVAGISRELWRNCYASDAQMLHKPIGVNGHSFSVVGIAPTNFRGATLDESAADLWVPLMTQAAVAPGEDLIKLRNTGWLNVLGRLKPGVAPKQAQADLNVLDRQLEASYPDKYRHLHVTAVPATALPAPVRDRSLVLQRFSWLWSASYCLSDAQTRGISYWPGAGCGNVGLRCGGR
jgi:hypothetical protein